MRRSTSTFRKPTGSFALIALALSLVASMLSPLHGDAASLITFTARNTTVGGGTMITAALNLNENAPSGGLKVRLRSSQPAVATVASSVTIAAGKRSALVKVSTFAVSESTYPKITATLGDSKLQLELKITSAGLAWISLPEEIPAGSKVKGTVKLDGVAPRGGLVVALNSGSTSLLRVPSTVKVPAGGNSVSFTATTYTPGSQSTVKVTAKLAKVAKSVIVTVIPPGVQSVDIKPLFIGPGQPGKGKVTLNAPAPAGGAVVTITPDNEAVSLPGTVTIHEGETVGTFTVTAAEVSAQTRVSISASYGGVTRSAIVYVKVAPAKVKQITSSQESITGGEKVRFTVTLTGNAATPGMPVQLTSSDPEILTVPASIMVPAGAAKVTITGTSVAVEGTVDVMVTASGGGGSATVSVRVEPEALEEP